MRVCFLLHELGRAGGMGVIAGHAERLSARPGWQAEVVVTSELDRVADVEWDFAFATWWETAESLWRVRARRRGVFLQSLEERYYRGHELLPRLGAASVLALPVDYVTVAGWIADVMSELRPDARCAVVRNGIDKAVFAPPAAGGGPAGRGDGPLRVLVEGQPEMWFKGVPEAIAAARAARAEVTVTLVAPEPAGAGGLGADRVTGRLDPPGMAALYAEHDVVLKLSRVESVGLVPLEAMHVGVPCVVAPYSGHEEYVRHGHNGIVVGFDDPAAVTAALDELAEDRALLRRLSEGALATAAEWPSAAASSDELARVLEELAAAPAPAVAPALAALTARQRLTIELSQGQLGELDYYRRAYEHAALTAVELRAELHQRGVEAEERIAAIQSERAYRAAARARETLKKVRRK